MLGNGKNTIDIISMVNQDNTNQLNIIPTSSAALETAQELHTTSTLRVDSGVDMTQHLSGKYESEGKQDSLEEEYDKWNLESVLNWLDENDFGEYKQNFAENNVHGKSFFELTHKALKNLDIPTITERVRLLNATKKVGLHRSRRNRRDSVQINTETLVESDQDPSQQSDITSDLDDHHSEDLLLLATSQQHSYRGTAREGYRENHSSNSDSHQHPGYPFNDNQTSCRESGHGYRDIYATYRDYQNSSRDPCEGYQATPAPVIRPRGSSKDYVQHSTLHNIPAVSPSSLTSQSGAATISITPRSSSRNIRFFSSSPSSSFDTHNQSPVSITDTSSTVSEYPS
ncbi:ATP binding, partial [Basidiobolus ranarum]